MAALWAGPLWRSARPSLLGGHIPDRQARECGVWPEAYRSIALLNNMIPPLAWQRAEAVERQPVSLGRQRRGGAFLKFQDACPRPGVAVLAGTLGPLLDISLLVAALDVCDDRLVHLRRRRGWRSGLGLRLRRGGGLGLRLRGRLVLLCHGERFPPPWCLWCR